ncbi:MAG: O-antigen ligase family protein, partial [Planctomycetaceae bacterium]|nr:O-antigen ligase family protein [Planctomycetaceae bacterium]
MADSRKSRGSGRRRTTRRESSRSGAALHEDRGDGLQSVLARWAETAAVALLVARILIPTEGAVQGDTLWIALLWFPLAALWLIVHPAAGGPSVPAPAAGSGSWWRGSSFRLADAGVLLLAAGHVLATGGVFALGGNRRSAVNLTWEWVALAVAWFVLKSMLARRGFRRQLVVILVALAVAESGYGIWQHYVWYPQTARLYSGIRTELDELESRTGLTSTEEARRSTLQSQLMERQIPLEGPSRLLWENRLNASTEPFGTFALANSFAGYLGGWLFVALGFAVLPLLPFAFPAGSRGGQSRTAGSIAVSLVLVVPLLLCLLLTKSRTAWAGSSCAALLVAVAAWLLWKRRVSAVVAPAGAVPADAAPPRADSAGSARQIEPLSPEQIPAAGRADKEVTGTDATAAPSPRRTRLVLAVAAFVLLAGVAAGLASLDAKVLSEAPRSVRFRLQYWHGAVQVIREHPLLGVGPGNFRQHYLAHKLPESSEEIADPHNLILDIWASAGLTALAGLLLLLAALGSWCWRTGCLLWRTPAESARWCAVLPHASISPAGSTTGAGRPVLSFSSGVVGGCAGFLLVLLSTE